VSGQAQLVVSARELGVAMGLVYAGRIIGWTTDAAKADALRENGLTVTECYNATGPRGWEIVAHPDLADAEPANDEIA